MATTTILNEITKEVFERYVPAAKMPERNSSVFNRLESSLKAAYHDLVYNIISPDFEDKITEDELLKHRCMRVVCLDAFARTCRSLDVVLTATGFGIVSTESLAPASKARVDALIEEVLVESMKIVDRIIFQHLVRVEGWGATEQARHRIVTLFFKTTQLEECGLALTTQNWREAQVLAVTADMLLRKEISSEYMDELLQEARTASMSIDNGIFAAACQEFIYTYIKEGIPNKFQLHYLVEELENNIEKYPTYQSSKLYAKRHAERYQTKRADPTFFCM